jgi:hypothetical protein
VDGPCGARGFLTFRRDGRVRSCVRPVCAVHMTAGPDGSSRTRSQSSSRTRSAGHLYEASPVKRFLRELRFLASQEACVCIHGVMIPCLAVLSRSSPNARMGCAFWAQGLDGEGTRRAIMVWAMSGLAGFSANELISLFVVRRSSVEVRFLFGPFDPRRSPY